MDSLNSKGKESIINLHHQYILAFLSCKLSTFNILSSTSIRFQYCIPSYGPSLTLLTSLKPLGTGGPRLCLDVAGTARTATQALRLKCPAALEELRVLLAPALAPRRGAGAVAASSNVLELQCTSDLGNSGKHGDQRFSTVEDSSSRFGERRQLDHL